MSVEELILRFAREHNYNEIVLSKILNDYSDFNGELIREPPRGYRKYFESIVAKNEGRAPYADVMPVGAVLIVKKSGKPVKKFYGYNKTPSKYEWPLVREFYPGFVTTVHAEFHAVLKFLRWYNWKEPSKKRRYDVDLLVARYSGNVPSRPCRYCRRMIRRLLADHSVTVIYPIDGRYYAKEKMV